MNEVKVGQVYDNPSGLPFTRHITNVTPEAIYYTIVGNDALGLENVENVSIEATPKKLEIYFNSGLLVK